MTETWGTQQEARVTCHLPFLLHSAEDLGPGWRRLWELHTDCFPTAKIEATSETCGLRVTLSKGNCPWNRAVRPQHTAAGLPLMDGLPGKLFSLWA